MLLLIFAASICITFLVWMSSRSQPGFEQIDNGTVVYVRDTGSPPADLLLGNYGIPLETKRSGRSRLIEVVFPKLNTDNQVEYVKFWYPFQDVEVLPANPSAIETTPQKLAAKIAPAVKHHFQIEKEISRLKQQYEVINTIADAATDLDSSSIDLYERSQIESSLQQSEALRETYVSRIREALIDIQP